MIPRRVKYVTPHHYSQIFLKICYLCKKGMKELLPSNVKLRLQCEACKTKDRQKLGYFLVTKEKLMSWISLVICFLFPQGPHHQSSCQVNLGPFLWQWISGFSKIMAVYMFAFMVVENGMTKYMQLEF